jgi:DNA repair exonuclease SbcCD ATPase subunit
VPTPAIKGDVGGTSNFVPPPTLEESEVGFGRQLRSGAEPEAAPIPLPWVLSRAHQALHETEVAILREWEALEAEHQRLSDWRTQLEECTKAASRQFAFERSELERDRKDYKKDLHKVYACELEASRKENRLAKREEALNQREEVVTELQAKLSAMNKILEEQRIQQTAAVERIQKWEWELEDMASNISLAEENLKEKDASLDKRETDLAWWEKDLAFREEMFERRDKLLAEYELEAEKEKELEERIRQLQAAQAASGPEVVEATKKALEDLQAKHHAGVQRIAAWASEASIALVPLGMSPIPVSELPTSISDALPVLDFAADRLRSLDQILGARLEAEGGRLCRLGS